VDNVNLVVGMLSDYAGIVSGWDVPEAWYFLGKAHGMRRMHDRECECLNFALCLAEGSKAHYVILVRHLDGACSRHAQKVVAI